MREAKLLNGMLFSTEAWSSISGAELTRIEQLDMALLTSLVRGWARQVQQGLHSNGIWRIKNPTSNHH